MCIGVIQEPGRAYQFQSSAYDRYQGKRETNYPGLMSCSVWGYQQVQKHNTKEQNVYTGITNQCKKSEVKRQVSSLSAFIVPKR